MDVRVITELNYGLQTILSIVEVIFQIFPHLLRTERHNLAPSVSSAPDAMTQARQLHDLAVVDEQVHVDAEFPNVPVVHLGVCSFEHDPFLGEFLHDTGDNVGSPRVHVLRDTLRLDHQAFDTGVEELVAQVHQLAGVGCADGFQAGSWGVTASTELDAQFGLGFEFV